MELSQRAVSLNNYLMTAWTGLVWNSGKTSSARTVNTAEAGKASHAKSPRLQTPLTLLWLTQPPQNVVTLVSI